MFLTKMLLSELIFDPNKLSELDFGRLLGLGTENLPNFKHFEQKIGKFYDFC